MSEFHTSVLLQETIDGLNVQKGKKYIDATLGSGGHTRQIVQRGGIVLGIDQDNEALEEAKKTLEGLPVTIVYGNFARLLTIAQENMFGKVAGVLFDIGISSHQVDSAERGFSFLKEGPLDMRMDKNLSVTAADLVNGLTKKELVELFTKYGEEPFALRIAGEIVKKREQELFTTTTQLAELIARIYPRGREKKIHPATKVFQALRIAVNDEMNVLHSALSQAVELLENKGRLAVISFHSLEDRVVKQAFVDFEKKGMGKRITDKPIVPTENEVIINPRSRSAKLRIFERV